MKRREDEIRILNLQIKQIEHPTEATRKLMQQIPELDEQVALLQKELLEARRQSEELSLALESPENVSRWRRLGGKAPDKDELTAKTRQLEERINDNKVRLNASPIVSKRRYRFKFSGSIVVSRINACILVVCGLLRVPIGQLGQ